MEASRSQMNRGERYVTTGCIFRPCLLTLILDSKLTQRVKELQQQQFTRSSETVYSPTTTTAPVLLAMPTEATIGPSLVPTIPPHNSEEYSHSQIVSSSSTDINIGVSAGVTILDKQMEQPPDQCRFQEHTDCVSSGPNYVLGEKNVTIPRQSSPALPVPQGPSSGPEPHNYRSHKSDPFEHQLAQMSKETEIDRTPQVKGKHISASFSNERPGSPSKIAWDAFR